MIKPDKKIVFTGIAVLIGVGFFAYNFSGTKPVDTPDVIQDIEPVPTETVEPVATPTSTPVVTEEPFLGLHGIKTPATCQVGGEVEFYDKGAFSSKDSQISWQNVDSQGRLINWRVSPQDDLAIGPNIFANLEVPDGKYENLTIRLPESPISKKYLLTASITYGQIIQGDVKVKETNCSGQVQVNLNF